MPAPYPPVKFEGVLDVIAVVLLVVSFLLVEQATHGLALTNVFSSASLWQGFRFAVAPPTEAPHCDSSGYGHGRLPHQPRQESPILVSHSQELTLC